MNTIYKQTTADTCLPSCLIMMLDKFGLAKPTQELELEILVEGDKLSRGNRTLGHLLYVIKKYKVKGRYFVSRADTFEEAQSLLLKEGKDVIESKKERIGAYLIEQLLKETEVITCIDDYALRKQIHFPHFIIVENFENKNFSLIDPWEGKRFLISSEEMENAFEMLDKLNFPREVLLFG
jgi:hypothetical protein